MHILIIIGGWDEHFITQYFFLIIFRKYYNLNISSTRNNYFSLKRTLPIHLLSPSYTRMTWQIVVHKFQ